MKFCLAISRLYFASLFCFLHINCGIIVDYKKKFRVRWDKILWATASSLYNVRRLNTLLSVPREVHKNVGKGKGNPRNQRIDMFSA